MTWVEDQTQKHIPLSTARIMSEAKFIFYYWKKRLDLTIINLLLALCGLNDSIIIIYYIMWKWLSLSADVKAAEEFFLEL